MDRLDYLLELYETQLENLEQDYQAVKSDLEVEQDSPTRNKL